MSAVNRKIGNENVAQSASQRRFGSEKDVERISGFSQRTLQKDRLLGRMRFPWYKVGGKVLYDLDEVEAIIRASIGGGMRPLA